MHSFSAEGQRLNEKDVDTHNAQYETVAIPQSDRLPLPRNDADGHNQSSLVVALLTASSPQPVFGRAQSIG